jgi:hypothetical protein
MKNQTKLITTAGRKAVTTATIALGAIFALGIPGQSQAAQETLVGSATADWEEGALSIENSVPGAAYSGDVDVYNDYGCTGTCTGNGRIGFKTDTGTNLGRTNGPGDNGVASEAFAFKFKGFNGALPWQNTVPFAFGTKGGRDTLWTPQFYNPGIPVVHMGQFSTDNGPQDEDSTVGVIERGDFRAIDGDFGAAFNCNRPGKVCFQKWLGTRWQQIGRTNGPGDDGNLISFTVLKVRKGYTLDVNGKIVNDNTDVPIAQINGVSYGRYLGLQTPNYGNNIGTQSMLLLPRLP